MASRSAIAVLAAVLTLAAQGVRAQPAAEALKPAKDCTALAAIPLQGGAEVTDVKLLPAGPRSIESPFGGKITMEGPSVCVVAATLRPTSDSEIKMEVWLPADGWNGRLLGVGNGGWGGYINTLELAERSRAGYVTVSTDTGHTGGSGAFAGGHPEKLADFGWRAIHLMTVNAKALTAAFYDRGPRYAYFNSCSGGGRQALMSAQRFPDDYDGIVAGAPASNWAKLTASSIWSEQKNLAKGPPIINVAQFQVLKAGALAKCDALDGVKDGEIADPRQCSFTAASLVCKAGQTTGCLTAEQAAVADHAYAPRRNPQTGAFLFPGPPPGSEAGWVQTLTTPLAIGIDQYRYVVHNDPNWDFQSLDWSKEVEAADKADNGLVIATNPDLSKFRARGGKLIHYHGWADHLIAPEDSVNYYESVVVKSGGLSQAQDFYRLYMIPAMGHCMGAYAADYQQAIEGWVERKSAPDLLLAKRLDPAAPMGAPGGPPPATVGERPICAYPAQARYDGTGDPNKAASFKCVAGPRGARPGHGPAKLGDKLASF